jgi:hypothetical protein
VADSLIKNGESDLASQPHKASLLDLRVPRFFRVSSNSEKETMLSLRRSLRLNTFDHTHWQPHFDMSQEKAIFDSIYTIDEKNTEDKIDFMQLPFTDYL